MCPTCCAAPPPPPPVVDVAVPCCAARPQAPMPLPPPPPAPSTVQCCKAAPVPLNPCCQAIVASPEPARAQCCLSAPTPANPCCQEALPPTCVCQMPRPVPCRCAAPPSEMECNGCMLPPPRPQHAPVRLDSAMFYRTIIFCHYDLSGQGERISLDLGPNIVTWGRVRKNGNEFIKHCQPEEKNIRCAQFVDEKNQAAIPTTDAHVNENGTLVINSFQATDVGDYFSPDELERVCY
ncbi:hypothetical protein Aduo_018626 [Ancylostoma duodenale]